MDSQYRYHLRGKVMQLQPAIFADNLTKFIMTGYYIPWNMMFTTKECYKDFFLTYGRRIMYYMENYLRPLYSDIPDLKMWHVNEDSFSKLLYISKRSLLEDSDRDEKVVFTRYCVSHLFLAAKYYKQGVKTAPIIAFKEVYKIACHYLKSINYKHDLVWAVNADILRTKRT